VLSLGLRDDRVQRFGQRRRPTVSRRHHKPHSVITQRRVTDEARRGTRHGDLGRDRGQDRGQELHQSFNERRL